MRKSVIKPSALLVAMTLVLTGCGGGSSSSPSQPTQPTVKPLSKPTIITKPANSTGTNVAPITNPPAKTNIPQPSSTETALSVLNTQRSACGFSTLANHDELVKASKNHNNYLAYISESNAKLNIFASHDEKFEQNWQNTGSANPYFSGKSVLERVKTRGRFKGIKAVDVNYPFATSYPFEENGNSYIMHGSFVTEDIATFSHTASDTQLLRNLLAAPYHLQSLVSPFYKDAGVHFHTSNEWNVAGYTPIKANYLTLVLGLQQGQSPQIANKTLSYPCNNTSGVQHTLTHEYPDPFAGHSRGTISEQNPIGQPIYIISPWDKTISNIKNVSLKPVNGLVAPKVWVMFKNANPNINLQQLIDPHKHLQDNEAFLIPDTKLQPATTYEVSYTLVYQDNSSENTKFNFTTKASL